MEALKMFLAKYGPRAAEEALRGGRSLQHMVQRSPKTAVGVGLGGYALGRLGAKGPEDMTDDELMQSLNKRQMSRNPGGY